MGAFFTRGATKQDIIKECLEPFDAANGGRVEVIAHSLRGNVLWTVREKTDKDGSKQRCIHCDVLKSHDRSWGYMPMDETVGPCYYNCPLKFLVMVPDPPPSEFVGPWREKVRAYHAEQRRVAAVRRSLKVGCVVKFNDDCRVSELRVESVKGGFLGRDEKEGTLYKFRAKDVKEVVPAEAVTA